MIKRQFIWDATGTAVGVILPIEEFALVKDLLEQQVDRPASKTEDEALELMERAMTHQLFIVDLNEVMSDFSFVDSEWWEPIE